MLARGEVFDPTTDASVRKLAMQVRQRLERYYAIHGTRDPVILTLPLRSYLPLFEPRPVEAAVPVEIAAPPPGRRWGAVAAALAILTVGLAGALWFALHPSDPGARTVILTNRGDISSPGPDAAPGALQLIDTAAPSEELTVLLSFPAGHEGQHAGLVIWEGTRRYVSLGRRFTSRNYVTFGHEYGSYFGDRPDGELDDPDAQRGAPLWLRLAKHGDTYSAFTSTDGVTWQPVGAPLTLPVPLKNPRFGIFAVNGRRESPSIPAAFEFLGKGIVLPETRDPQGPWTFPSNCPEGADIFEGLRSTVGAALCTATWSAPVSKPAWSLTTKIDLLANAGISGGAFVQSEHGRVRLFRDYSDGPRINLIHDGVKLEPVPDFPGSPPVFLRLSSSGDRITGEVSIDGREFRTVGSGISLAAFGKVKTYGIMASRHPRMDESPIPPLRMFFAREDLLR